MPDTLYEELLKRTWDMELKKGLLWMTIGMILTVTIATAIAFLFGKFGDFFWKMVSSTLTLGWYGFMFLITVQGGARISENRDSILETTRIFGGLILIFGIVWGLCVIWEFIDDRGGIGLKWFGTAVAWSIAVAWFAQLYTRTTKVKLVHYTTIGTSFLLAVAALLLTLLIWDAIRPDDSYLVRLFGMSSVLTIGGTLALVFLRKMTAEVPSVGNAN